MGEREEFATRHTRQFKVGENASSGSFVLENRVAPGDVLSNPFAITS